MDEKIKCKYGLFIRITSDKFSFSAKNHEIILSTTSVDSGILLIIDET